MLPEILKHDPSVHEAHAITGQDVHLSLEAQLPAYCMGLNSWRYTANIPQNDIRDSGGLYVAGLLLLGFAHIDCIADDAGTYWIGNWAARAGFHKEGFRDLTGLCRLVETNFRKGFLWAPVAGP